MAQSYFTKNLDIFSIYRATKSRSVHKNDQYVQGFNPNNYFFRKLNTMVHARLATNTTLEI